MTEDINANKTTGSDSSSNPGSGTSNGLFESMTHSGKRWIFLLGLPILWSIFIGIGWSREDRVESSVSEIWTQQRSSYKKDSDYQEKWDALSATTSFGAMAISRDGENLFTPERLEQVRKRMEETENTTIEYNGHTITWDDVCGLNSLGMNTTYKFPCARLSPMDYFQEARWFFDDDDRVTWYTELAKKTVIAPRIPRFGIMTQVCSTLAGGSTTHTECNALVLKRVLANTPLKLFEDIGRLEMNDPCKQCIEDETENVMRDLLAYSTQMFTGLSVALKADGNHTDLANTIDSILSKLDLQAIIDYFSYKTIRGLYGMLGGPSYLESYKQFQQLCRTAVPDLADSLCADIDLDEAEVILKQHADHAFSSTSTAGVPLPFFGDDGEGYLFQGNSPVSGSGVDLSGVQLSALQYLGQITAQNVAADPNSADWANLVETDPIYRWFLAGETEMAGTCSNGPLKGTNGTALDALTAALIQSATDPWCTKFNKPFETMENRTQQYFARMWYGLLVDSPSFMNLTQGYSDPYTWTLGIGCGYKLGGQRFSYRSGDADDPEFEAYLLGNASGELYFIDEGDRLGPVDRNLMVGAEELDPVSNSATKVGVMQTFYPALRPDAIVQRVSNCNRPGGPIDISVEDAEEILYEYKKAFEESWTRGWDDENTEVQFVGYFDDASVSGTAGRLLEKMTLSNGTLLAASILIIAFFSILFLFDRDPLESRVLVTLVGVSLVLMAFFAAVGFGIMVGIKVNINIAWTLPFIMLGLGVDDMYIVMLALKEQKGYDLSNYLAAMKEVVVPVSMTSMVNAGMFAVMNVNDIPAVFLTAQVALISVVFLYLSIIFCFPAWCWIDMQRQSAGRRDVIFCTKANESYESNHKHWTHFFYDRIYKPLVLGSYCPRLLTHIVIWLVALALFGVGSYGLTERKLGLGLEDLFPSGTAAHRWATVSSEALAAWPVEMNWGAIDYKNPSTQMRMIQQFEEVVATPRIAEIDTQQLWMADFLVWSSRHCTANFVRDDADVLACGRDQVFSDGTSCSGSWVENTFNLREKLFEAEHPDICLAYEGGICRPTRQMHPDDIEEFGIDTNEEKSWCPVFEGWSDEKLGFCIKRWRELTGGSGSLVLLNETGTPTECSGEYYSDESVRVPIPISKSPNMYAYDLMTHEITIDMIEETRAICDDDPEVHCFLTGIPYDYWSQYIGIFGSFAEIAGCAVAVGFVISFLFLLGTSAGKPMFVLSSFIGAFLITLTTILSLISVAGLSVLAGVQFTGFSNVSMVLSVGFSVEYSVHVVQRWLLADAELKGIDRVEHTMSFLFLPTFMSFLSSLIGVVCLAFTDFEFNEVYFFRPLVLVMPITYFFGCWWLPVALSNLNLGFLGKDASGEDGSSSLEKNEADAVGEEGSSSQKREEPQEEAQHHSA